LSSFLDKYVVVHAVKASNNIDFFLFVKNITMVSNQKNGISKNSVNPAKQYMSLPPFVFSSPTLFLNADKIVVIVTDSPFIEQAEEPTIYLFLYGFL
jgi:hypothetical protein